MVLPFPWNDGEGYDIHVLRGPTKSKPLLPSLQVDTTSPTRLAPTFTPNFTASASVLGVSVDSQTGEVTALLQPPGQPNKFPSFNFLIKAQQIIGGVETHETEIRVHVHNSIKSIWLTPSSLNPHVGSDECRFSVLARFDDDVVGDITDRPPGQLSVTSSLPSVVAVLARGVLQAKVAGKPATITATLKVGSTQKTATAQVMTKPSWIEVGRAANLQFVAGPVQPNPTDLDSASADSVKSVAEARTNILFISEGFLASQEQDFRKSIVDFIVKTELQAQEYLQPFKLLAKSINYWAVFLESAEEGTSVLGDQAVDPTTSIARAIPLPRAPDANASQWTAPNMVHEGGLPLPKDPLTADPNAWVASRNHIYTLPSGVPTTPAIGQADVNTWNRFRPRFELNERNTAFGVAHFDRPKVSDEDASPDRLLFDGRRMSGASLADFLSSLTFGNANSQVWGVGKTWAKSSVDGKDAGLVCLICRSDLIGGGFTQPTLSGSTGYFTVSTGDRDQVTVKTAGDGQEIVPPTSMAFSAPLLASLVAYGCGQALGLGNEEGNGEATAAGNTSTIPGVNLEAEVLLVSTTAGQRSINVKKIAWLWPRIANSAPVEVKLDPSGAVISPQNCDQQGTPNPTGAFLLVHLLSAPPKPFAVADLVRLRGALIRFAGDLFWKSPSEDDIAGFPLRVESLVGSNTLVLSRQVPNVPQLGYHDPAPGTQLQPALFQAVE